MFTCDAPPPAIIQPGEPWEARLTAALAARRIPMITLKRISR